MHKSVDKCVDNSMDKFEDNSEDKLLKSDQRINWYNKLAFYLNQSPFYHGQNHDGARLLFEKLGEAIEEGDSCLEYKHIDFNCLEIIQKYEAGQQMLKPIIWDEPYLYLQRYWALEHDLAHSFKELLNQSIENYNEKYDDLFEDIHQKQALKKGTTLPFCMITGGPGTGKTFILTRIVAVLKASNPQLRIAMAAPTGKAAQRMQEALQIAFADRKLVEAGLYHPDFKQQQTQTLHRLLGMGNRQIAKYNQDHPLPYDVIVVDEASMLDLSMAKTLFAAIKAPTRLILLGDANQLSSVDVGYVLSDLQKVEALKPYQQNLVKSRRFFDDAMIGRFAHYIYQGSACVHNQPELLSAVLTLPEFSIEQWQALLNPYEITEDVYPVHLSDTQDWVGFKEISENIDDSEIKNIYQLLVKGYEDYFVALTQFKAKKIDKKQLVEAFDRYRILVAMRHGALGVEQINQMMTNYLKHKLNIPHEQEWYLGRPVMMIHNDYQLGLSNGDIGLCWLEEDAITQDTRYQIYFPSLDRDILASRLPQSIPTAFAMTIHKSQGSEFRHVAVVLDDNAKNLLSKELIYTAITRAKKLVSLFSSKGALEQSFHTKTNRTSGLHQQIQRILD